MPNISDLKKKYQTFPNQPGVYIFSNQKKDLYIGKAKNLKKRVAYYFKLDMLPKRLNKMVSEATELNYFITETEQDALLLEAQFIKEKQPVYNIMYREGRSLYYLNFEDGIKGEKTGFPRLVINHDWKKDAIGPFLSVEYLNSLLSELLKIFKIRTCTDYFFKHRKRPCLEYHANRCSAPCVGLIEQDEYIKNKKAVLDFFKGKSKEVVSQWKQDLKDAIKTEHFELATLLRNKIISAEKLQIKQSIHFENVKKVDVVTRYKNYFYLESIKNGAVIHIEYRKYSKKIDLAEFLWDYYLTEPVHKIIGPKAEEGVQLYKTYSSNLNTLEKKIFENATKRMHALIEQEQNTNEWMQELGITHMNSIEVYDSSHYTGKHALCGMIFFDGTKFVKNKYRYWKLSKETKNDLEILANTMERRLQRKNAKSDLAENDLPNVILLDGGVTQLNTVYKLFEQYNISQEQCKLLAFAKGEGRKGGIVYEIKNGKSNILEISPKLKLLFEKLRDEAHRWAKKNASNAFEKSFFTK